MKVTKLKELDAKIEKCEARIRYLNAVKLALTIKKPTAYRGSISSL